VGDEEGGLANVFITQHLFKVHLNKNVLKNLKTLWRSRVIPMTDGFRTSRLLVVPEARNFINPASGTVEVAGLATGAKDVLRVVDEAGLVAPSTVLMVGCYKDRFAAGSNRRIPA